VASASVDVALDRGKDYGFAKGTDRSPSARFDAIASGEVLALALGAQRTTTVVEVESGLLPGAIVLAATITVVAAPAGRTYLGDVALVRAEGSDPSAASSAHVVDFQALRVVAGVSHPQGVTRVERWQPPEFVPVTTTPASFGDVQTDRLRLTLNEELEPTDVATNGTVVVLTPPADLQLTVGGMQVWAHPGPVKPTEEDGATFRHEVVLTPRQIADLNAALADPGGAPPITVSLRSSAPGRLQLAATMPRLQIAGVPFPEGADRHVPFDAEGSAMLALEIPAVIASKQVALLRSSLRAPDPGPARVLPPVGPEPSEAELVLDADRAVAVRISGNTRAALGALHAIRLYVAAGPTGAELLGFLRAEASGTAPAVGPLVGDATFGPVTLAPGPGQPAWVTASLATPRDLKDDGELWVELRVTRGTVAWRLARPVGGGEPDARFDALVRRAMPSGDFGELSRAFPRASGPAGLRRRALPVPTGSGMVRVVGKPPPDRPIPVLDVDVDVTRAGGPLRATELARSVTPTTDGTPVSFTLTPAAAAIKDGVPLSLILTAFAPIDLTVGQISVGYQ